MAMWRPPQRIRHTPQPGRWPTAEQAQSARLFSPTRIGPANRPVPVDRRSAT